MTRVRTVVRTLFGFLLPDHEVAAVL